jgi:metalloendopeptidase OMA1, mitochondrial
MIFLSTQPLLIFLVLMSLSGCTTNPYTGRWQFVPFPSSYMTGLGAQSYADSYADVLNSPNVKISKDPQEVEPVQQVAERIIEAAKQSKYAEKAKAFKWEVAVIEDNRT